MHQAAEDKELMKWAKETLVEEAGVGLINKFKGFPDELFSEDGFINYAEDALALVWSTLSYGSDWSG